MLPGDENEKDRYSHRVPKLSPSRIVLIVVFVVLVVLGFSGVLPSRSERYQWSAEKRLLYGLGSMALVVGLAVGLSKLKERDQ